MDHVDTVQLLTDREVPVTSLTDRVLTHRVSTDEAAVGSIDLLDIDLLAVTLLTDAYGEVPLPPGCAVGDLIAVRWAADRPTLETIADAGVGTIPADIVTALQSLLAEHGPVVEAEQLMWTLWADRPAAFTTPLPPLVEILDAAGLPYDDEQVGSTGVDLEQHWFEERIEEITRRHHLNGDQALSVAVNLLLLDQVHDDQEAAAGPPGGRDDSREIARQSLSALADPDVAEAFLVEAIGAGREQAATLRLFAESSESRAPHGARAALRWLRGKACERMGDVPEAVMHFDAAASIDPSWTPNLLDLARVASDQGDAQRGLSLLRRAHVPADDDLVRILETYRAADRVDHGRNEPCWCGSGRKYKACHRGHEQQPLSERAGWLYAKAEAHILDGPWRWMRIDLAGVRSQYHGEDMHALLAAMVDPLVLDAVLFEGGALAEFVEQRGYLLPDDEQLLAQQWLLCERSVFEVEEVRRGVGLTVRDVRTGDRHDVRERQGSRQVTVGMLLCTRIVPAGDTMQAFGGIEPVHLQDLGELIELLDNEPEPEEVVEILSRRFAPPVLQNTEGDPLLLCRAVVTTTDQPALVAALDGAYVREEDEDPPQWHEYVTTGGLERLRATIVVEAAGVVVETNSAARMDRVLDAIRTAHPASVVLSDVRTTVDDARRALPATSPTAAGSGAGMLDPSDPQVAAMLAELMQHYEQSWLDESIPALAGMTPRQAADDPTRRPELIRLLASFPDDDSPSAMSPRRLRAALGLE